MNSLDCIGGRDIPRANDFRDEHYVQYYEPFCSFLSMIQSMDFLPSKSHDWEGKQRVMCNCVSLSCAFFSQRSYVSPSNIFETLTSILKLRESSLNTQSDKNLSVFWCFGAADYRNLVIKFLQSIGIHKTLCHPQNTISKRINLVFPSRQENLKCADRELFDIRSLWIEKLAIDS